MNNLSHLSKTQFNPALPVQLQRTSCGIYCMIAAISYLKDIELNPLETIQDFASFGRYSKPIVTATFPDHSVNGVPLRVPLLFGESIESAEEIMQRFSSIVVDGQERKSLKFEIEVEYPIGADNANQPVTNYDSTLATAELPLQVSDSTETVYRPTFMIDRGTDSRGVVEWLQNRYGLSACIIEYIPASSNMVDSASHTFLHSEQQFLTLFKSVVEQKENVEIGGTELLPESRRFVMASVVHDEIGKSGGIRSSSSASSETHLVGVLHSDSERLIVVDSAVPRDVDGMRVIEWEKMVNGLLCSNGNKRERCHFVVVW